MEDVTIVVATHGDRQWQRLAEERALPSARAQGRPTLAVHGGPGTTLAQARNRALDDVSTPWVIHLDADDELAPGYVAAMLAADGDIRAPAVSWVPDGAGSRLPAEGTVPAVPQVPGHEVLHPQCHGGCLAAGGNWIVVGAMVRTAAVRRVGKWRELPLYEDYDLWLRLTAAGAQVGVVPDAVYRAHVRPGSRNRSHSPLVQRLTVREIMRHAGVGPAGGGARWPA